MSAENDESLLDRLVNGLSRVPGARAIALGGSRALGTASEHSDYDLGVYYDPNFALDIDALRAVAVGLDDSGPVATVTPICGWGPWINGGGWLTIRGQPVDVLYRDLSRTRRVIDECPRASLADTISPAIHTPSSRPSTWGRSPIIDHCGIHTEISCSLRP